MKEVINLQGEKEQVSINTTVKTINGVHYLLTKKDLEEIDTKEQLYQADINKRRKAERKALVKAAMAEADEMIPEVLAGEIDAQVWLNKRNEIKQKLGVN